MFIELFEIGALLAVLILPFFFPYKKKTGAVKIPADYNDTSEANYAINEHGFLEKIQHDKVKSHAN
ncbi:hypothetical protein [Mucilaginibacter xinganensis]|uniref:Uncharacterized protein n=1 Tax=Mucilaginibacter xinganensis TaxID=1234841 RepID=A0A223NTN9_9SPHI|nr:hypothetical protein [Mucilaginibacter xinganensis]ASU33044.1 hypothetical protein MuYL_1144 [Mucilaginibacter xinganensis]